MRIGMALNPAFVSGRDEPEAFGLEITGTTNGAAIVGDHAGIGYTEDPVSATETVKWSNSSDPAAAATYGIGAAPTDYTAGDGGYLWLHVTDGGDTVSRAVPIRYALPAAFTAGQWSIAAA